MTHTRAVAIVGGGPAGCMAAIRLAHAGISVVLIERGRRPVEFGETLSPDGRRTLSRAGVWERVPRAVALRCDGIATAWQTANVRRESFLRNPYGPAWHLHRPGFDEWLVAEAASSGAEIIAANARDVERVAEGWNVRLDDGGVIAASFLVIATGRTGSFAAKLARRSRLESLCVVGGFAAGAKDNSLLVEAVSSGWWYSLPMPDGRLFAGWVTDPEVVRVRPLDRAFASSLNETSHTRARVNSLDSIVTRAATTSALDSWFGDRWIAIGDAALSRDPLSGDGIASALRSGWNGAGTILQSLDAKLSNTPAMRERADYEVRDYVRSRSRVYRAQPRWGNAPFWKQHGR